MQYSRAVETLGAAWPSVYGCNLTPERLSGRRWKYVAVVISTSELHDARSE